MTAPRFDDLVLDLPGMSAFPSHVEALTEGFKRGIQPAKTPAEIVEIAADPKAYLAGLNDNTPGSFVTPSGETVAKVPYETLWLTAGPFFVGEVSFRHELSPFLMRFGGHIGYGVHPSLQGRGYATRAVALVKRRAAAMGLDRLLLTCSPGNPASERVILKSGGIYENTDPAPYGYGPTRRFWIALDNKETAHA
jgi:predicted acetyltransferase